MNSPSWSPLTRLIVLSILFLGSIALILWAFPLVETLLISGLVAYFFDPLVRWMMKRFNLRRGLAAAILYSIILILLASIPAVMGTLAVTQLQRLGNDLQSALKEIEKWISQPILLFGFDLSPRNLIQQFGQSAGSTVTALGRNSMGIISDVTTNFLWVLMGFVSLFYFLRDGPKIKPWLIELVSPVYQHDANRLLDEVDRVWGLFLRVQVIIFIVLAILFILGSALVVWFYQLGWIPFSTLGFILTLVIVYALVQQVDNLWLRPQMLGSQLRLHPGVVFVALIGALAMGGVIAAIMIVPFLASAKVIGQYVRLKLLDLPPWPDELETDDTASMSAPASNNSTV